MASSSMIGRTITVSQYRLTIKQKIGEGGYGVVYRVEDQNKTNYALKYVNCLTRDRFDQFLMEANVLMGIEPHPNIVRLYHYIENESSLSILFLYEFCPGTAMGMLSQRMLTTQEVLAFITGMASAAAHLHSNRPVILHRDLKPENLLVASDGTPKLCDFGSCTTTIYDLSQESALSAAQIDIEQNTTPIYRAPEMIDLNCGKVIGPPADVWAIGCSLYKLAFREDLFKMGDRLAILQARVRMPVNCDSAISELIAACIKADPYERITAQALFERASSFIETPAKIMLKTAAGIKSSDSSISAFFMDMIKPFFAQGREKWIAKMSPANANPPKMKYVRRILVDLHNSHDIEAKGLIELILKTRQWNSDHWVAAKCLYMVYLIIQSQENVASLSSITILTDEVDQRYQRMLPNVKNRSALSIISRLAELIRLKLTFHSAHTQVTGHMTLTNTSPDQMLAGDLERYISGVAQISTIFMGLSTMGGGFVSIVLFRPVASELAESLSLSQKLGINSAGITSAHAALASAKKLQYISTSVP